MYCQNCGNELQENSVVCSRCGYSPIKRTTESTQNIPFTPTKTKDKKSFLLALIGFFFPLIALLIALCIRNDYPLKTKSLIKGVIALCVTLVILIVLYFLFVLLLMIFSVSTAA